jgi:hypothetical protein
VRNAGEKLLPEVLLDLPQVGCLPGEGGAMHTSEVREEVGVVATEVRKELRIFIESQELSDDLDGEDFRVAERWCGSTCSETAEVLDPVVDEAEDGDDEGAKIHERRPPIRRSVWSLPSVGRSSVWLKSSKKLAHGVS